MSTLAYILPNGVAPIRSKGQHYDLQSCTCTLSLRPRANVDIKVPSTYAKDSTVMDPFNY